MAYVVIVFCMINALALGAGAIILLNLSGAVMETVQTVIEDEVRKQDDRIEKRLQRAERPSQNGEDPLETHDDTLRAGVPHRRR